MGFFIAAACFAVAVYIYWKMHNIDHDPNVPGPVSHVILPAAGLPVAGLMIIIGLLVLVYSFGWINWFG